MEGVPLDEPQRPTRADCERQCLPRAMGNPCLGTGLEQMKKWAPQSDASLGPWTRVSPPYIALISAKGGTPWVTDHPQIDSSGSKVGLRGSRRRWLSDPHGISLSLTGW